MREIDPKDFPENGFIIVASLKERFYEAALECAESVKLFWPEAHITIFVDHEESPQNKVLRKNQTLLFFNPKFSAGFG